MYASFWLRACAAALAGLAGLSMLARKDAAARWFLILSAGLVLMFCSCLAAGRVASRVDDAGGFLAALAAAGFLLPLAAGRQRGRGP
jgi:hypothetical protein